MQPRLHGFDHRAEYLGSRHGAYFRGSDHALMLTGLIDAWLPYRVFAELADLFKTWKPPALRGAYGPWLLVTVLKDEVAAGRFGWDALPGWVLHDPDGTRHLLDVYGEPTAENLPRLTRERWTSWHPYWLEAGRAATHPGLWSVAGFRPAEVRDMLAAGTAPDLETVRTMAALRRGPLP